MSKWPPEILYFNGAQVGSDMHVSSVPFAGGIPYLLDAPPAPELKYRCSRCKGTGEEPAVGPE